MANLKFKFKVPSIIALTLAGTALTTHHAHAAEKTQDQTSNSNVLDDQHALDQSKEIKDEISNPTTNISGTQVYQDPSIVKAPETADTESYDAQLDSLNNAADNETEAQDESTDETSQETDVQQEAQASQDGQIETSNVENSATDAQSDDVSAQDTEANTQDGVVASTDSSQNDDDTADTDQDFSKNETVSEDATTSTDVAQDEATETPVTTLDNEDVAQPVTDAQNEDAQSTEQETTATTDDTALTTEKDANEDTTGQDDKNHENVSHSASQHDLDNEAQASTTHKVEDNNHNIVDKVDNSTTQNDEHNPSIQDVDANSTEVDTDLHVTSTEDADAAQSDKHGQETTAKAAQSNDAKSTDSEGATQSASTSDDDSDVAKANEGLTHATPTDAAHVQRTLTPVQITAAPDKQGVVEGHYQADHDKFVEDEVSETTTPSDEDESNLADATPTDKAHEHHTLTAAQVTASPNKQDEVERHFEEVQAKYVAADDDVDVPSNTSTFRAASKAPKLKLPKYAPKVNSSINNYIRSKNYKVPTYEQSIASYLPQFNYRYGKPEGIVMHDTANDSSTIDGEVNFMKNNYSLAFVHAYVDGNRIIETANTDYGAWGAGPVANQRFIHVELVHTHDYDSFARSINNYADYAATNLLYYGLKPDSAEYDGQGTVWTHRSVSNYLGGTDHVDPHGYLAMHNYSYDELYDLIYEKYLIKTNKVAPWGTASSGTTTQPSKPAPSQPKPSTSTGKQGTLSVNANSGVARINSSNKGLYTTVYDQKGKKATQTNQTLKVTKAASLGSEKFYLVSDYNKGNLIGWVHQNDVNYNKAGATKSVNQTYKVKSGETLYLVPWGTSAQKAGTVSGKGLQSFKATKQQVIGSTPYIYGTVNKLSGWISASHLTSTAQPKPAQPKPKAPAASAKLVVTPLTNAQGTVAKSNHGLYTTVYDQSGVQKSYLNGKTYQLTKKATLGQKSFYLLTDKNTNIGWMLTSDVAYKDTTPKNVTTAVSKIGQVKTNNSGIRATVFDPAGKKANVYGGKTFTITKQRTQGNETYVLLQNERQNTPIGWLNAKDIQLKNLSKPTAAKGQYTIKPSTQGLYSIPWGTNKQLLDNLKQAHNSVFNVSKSIKVDNNAYLYGTTNNKTGWINSKDLTPVKATAQSGKAVTKEAAASKATPFSYEFVVTNKNGLYYSSPTAKNGTALTGAYASIFKVIEQQTVNGVTWYHGKLSNGKLVWIKASDLSKALVNYYRSNMTLDQAAKLQYNLAYRPQVQHVPGKWTNASLAEIKAAMDSDKLAKDATQKYQFLRLDMAQNLSVASLNKLLAGKGILEGQGEAFSEAAKMYNINEIYLISHVLLETGNGTSTLANGGNVVNNKVVTTGKKYYNMFGIGAVDSDAVRGGFNYAKQAGWDTVKKAIVGGAHFIAGRYIHEGQNTLYKMRWNPANPGTHQYATDIGWAKQNAIRIKSFYDQIKQTGKYFDVNTYQK
ncbi:GW dipeptide domain-containing protein [Staphylococcus argensis]|uniref:GW dipeptide domain-containing protein n=1 Tax=Staphylococcus argensis TaxID=1607738 RepID=UPI00119CEDCB|nr:GW dipeptide domain-containing protein [Staphylococcus argensis]